MLLTSLSTCFWYGCILRQKLRGILAICFASFGLAHALRCRKDSKDSALSCNFGSQNVVAACLFGDANASELSAVSKALVISLRCITVVPWMQCWCPVEMQNCMIELPMNHAMHQMDLMEHEFLATVWVLHSLGR